MERGRGQPPPISIDHPKASTRRPRPEHMAQVGAFLAEGLSDAVPLRYLADLHELVHGALVRRGIAARTRRAA